MTSVHLRYDTRIFVKMCSSLAKAGYDVSLIVADNKGYEEKNGVKIFDVGKPAGRLQRMLNTSALVYKRALQLDADVYHLHDPELLPYAYLLKLKGKKVIFDSHEDVPRDLFSKTYLPRWVLFWLSMIVESLEKVILKSLLVVIAATPHIKEILVKYNKNTFNINNFPIINELYISQNEFYHCKYFCYVGDITTARGLIEVFEALQHVKNDTKLCLAGNFKDISIDKIKDASINNKIEYVGYVSREGIKNIFKQSIAGLVTFLPLPNHIDAQPNKMFEYMSAGLPVIASNFPLWKEIIEGNKCGICVDPMKPEEIAKAIDYLYEHPEEARQMGQNGQKAVYEKYNWNIEEKKLLNVYEKIMNKG